jgi:hypothetical protein
VTNYGLVLSHSVTSILPFSGGGECPVQYFLTWKEHHYYVRYRDGWISVAVDDQEVYEKRLGARFDGFLSDEETTVYLWEISRAICESTLSKLSIPTLFEAQSHALYIKGPLPLHPVGLSCGQQQRPRLPSGVPNNRHTRRRRREQGIHDHTVGCMTFVPAQDVDSWVKVHPTEHLAFCEEYPAMWAAYKKSQATVVNEKNKRSWPGIPGCA